MYRLPKTANEMRAAADPEIANLVRGKRNFNNLPDAWDDIISKKGRSETPAQISRRARNFRESIRRV